MRVEKLTESSTSTLELSDEQAALLRQLGRSLTSDSDWWGAGEEDEEKEHKPRTMIDVYRGDEPGTWRVTVKNAVGLVSLRDLQLEVEPKIPLDHLVYLFEQANAVPRLEETIGHAETGVSLWRLIARWYVAELEMVLRRDLVRGYEHHQEQLKTVKGRVRPIQVGTAYYRGNLDFDCEFEEFKPDTPLNRTLRAAARKVSSLQTLDRPTRKRGVAGTRRMEEVGELHPSDLRAELTRATAHYRNAILLARHLLLGVGRLPATGSAYAKTFLIPTPKLVEKGILSILKSRLGNTWDIRPRSLALTPSSVTVNPDLVFNDGLAVGDVKYKLFADDWSRRDLYQCVAFATAFGTLSGCVIGFRTDSGTSIPPVVKVGAVRITPMVWTAVAGTSPEDSSATMADQIAAWLTQASNSV